MARSLTAPPAAAARQTAGSLAPPLADMLSLVAMVCTEEEDCKTLAWKLRGNPQDVASWGHEYVRHLTGDVSKVRAAPWREPAWRPV